MSEIIETKWVHKTCGTEIESELRYSDSEIGIELKDCEYVPCV